MTRKAITALVGLSVLVVGVIVAMPWFTKAQAVPRLGLRVSVMRQWYLLRFQMETDEMIKVSEPLSAPGDWRDAQRRVGKAGSLTDYYRTVVQREYLEADALKKLLARSGFAEWNGVLADLDARCHSPFKWYALRYDDPNNTFFVATRNFTAGLPMKFDADAPAAAQPRDSFVVLCKGGEAYEGHNASLSMGRLPGRLNEADAPVERAGDMLEF